MNDMQERQNAALKKKVYALYGGKGRGALPWRKNQSPYRVFVSEFMLQQTQVDRVVPKFNAFVKKYPNFKSLSLASLPEVFLLWQGLGYNRRAKYLRDSARRIVRERRGTLPNDREYLESLPGIGPYSAGAICAFAFGNPDAFIETNIRTAVLHHHFKNKENISDSVLLKVLKTMEPKKGSSAQAWYAGLMDYGAHLKRSGIRLNPKSAHYVRQSKFKGSRRELRGALMRSLLSGAKTKNVLIQQTKRTQIEVVEEIQKLIMEGLIRKEGKKFALCV